MSKCIACLLAAFALLLGTVTAKAVKAADKPTAEERFKKLDKDGDGKLTMEEYKGKKTGEKAEAAEKDFKARDKDNDGFLTLDEFSAKIKKDKN